VSRQLPSFAIDAPHRWVHYTLLFLLGLAAAWSNGPLKQPISFDNQVYFYIAERVASGVPPHVSLVDHKHALSSIVSGIGILGGRTLGLSDIVSVRYVSMAFAALVPVGVWMIGFGITRNAIVAHLSAFIVLAFDDFFLQAAMGLRPQVFMAAFMVFALAMLEKRRCLLSGAFAVAAFLCWQPALLVVAGILVALALGERPVASVLRFLAGILLVLLPYELYFYLHGALAVQLEQSYRMAGDVTAYKRPTFAESLYFILRDSHWGMGYKILIPGLYLLFITGLAIEVYARPRAALEVVRKNPLTTAVVLCGGLTLTFTFIDHQAYPDRYFVQPFIALTNGIVLGFALTRLLSVVAKSEVAKLRTSAVLFLSGIAALLTVKEPTQFAGHAYTVADQEILADRVGDFREQYGSVWTVGCPHLLALRRESNFDPIGMVLDSRVRSYAASRGEDGVYRPLNGGMPGVLLTSRGGEGKAFPWLNTEYRRFEDKAFKLHGIVVWVRKKCIADNRCSEAAECDVTPECSAGGKARRAKKPAGNRAAD
jgi:hypothetical protein